MVTAKADKSRGVLRIMLGVPNIVKSKSSYYSSMFNKINRFILLPLLCPYIVDRVSISLKEKAPSLT